MATKKIRRFDKVINDNPEAMAIYEEQQAYRAEAKTLDEECDKLFRVYFKMEGKYSIGTMDDPWGGQGTRGFMYKYPSDEVKKQEENEREAYYKEHIAPVKKRMEDLRNKACALEESLCIAVWGFGTDRFTLQHNLQIAEKELAGQIAYVEELREKLKKLEKGA